MTADQERAEFIRRLIVAKVQKDGFLCMTPQAIVEQAVKIADEYERAMLAEGKP